MCIRDRAAGGRVPAGEGIAAAGEHQVVATEARGGGTREVCLLYTSDAADERSSVDLGGRRIIKKQKQQTHGMTDKHTR